MSLEDMIEIFKHGIEHKPAEEAEQMRVMLTSMINTLDAIRDAEQRLKRLERRKQVVDAIKELRVSP